MYCFLSASLPEIVPGEVPPLSVAEFDALCAENLSASEMRKLVCWDDPEAEKMPAVYREMRRFKAVLQWRIAQLRSAKLERPVELAEPEELSAEIDYYLPAAAAVAPAEREAAVDAILWRHIDELELEREFSLEHLCLYRLRLKLMEKYARRASGKGRNNFENAVDHLSRSLSEA